MDYISISNPLTLNDIKIHEDIDNEVIKRIADNVISPVLISFVWWVLVNALKNKHKTLYFLARDGYIMSKIAEQFCVRFDLDVACRYLYGSRLAWRTAAYNFIGDEKYKYIFSGGYLLTPRIILKRVLADKEQRNKIYTDINDNMSDSSDKYDLSNENQALNSKSMKIFSEKLKKSRVFIEYLNDMSRRQFQSTTMYLYQEGVFDGNDIVLVDSGWTGSIQRTLRQIAGHNQLKPNIKGYYFGLYSHSSDVRDGKYETWYFNPRSPLNIMTNFNNNVFECMCASPFNMTTGYKFAENAGIYIPIFDTSSENNSIKAKHLNYCIENYTSDFLNNHNIKFENYSDIYLERSGKLMKKFMINPTKEEAEAFGQFKFCDDASSSYENNLARYVDRKYLKNYNIVKRFLHKLSGKRKNEDAAPALFWLHGSLALSEIKNQKRCRANYKLWEFLRLMIKKYRTA